MIDFYPLSRWRSLHIMKHDWYNKQCFGTVQLQIEMNNIFNSFKQRNNQLQKNKK